MRLPKSMIIVEDEVITQQYLSDVLSNNSIDVLACLDNAKDTLLELKELSPDMILMDINLTGPMDGITLAREILTKRKIPIIFVTAYSDDTTKEEVSELNYCGFIAKPLSGGDIMQIIEETYSNFLTIEEEEFLKKNVSDILLSNEYRFSYEDQTLYSKNKPLELNPKQNLLINILVKNYRHPVSVETLKTEIWEKDSVSDSTLRTLIYSVRKLAPNLEIIPFTKIGYSIN